MNVGVTFNGNKPGDFFRVNYNDAIAVVITGLKADTDYSVTLGATPNGAAITRTADKDGTLTINYTLNGADIFNEYVRVESITLANGAPITPDDPKPPVETKYTLKISETVAAHSNVTVNGTAAKDGDVVKADDVIAVVPADALEVVRDEDAKTVTVKPKTGWAWSNKFEAWVGYVDGNMNMIPFGAAGSMFSLARAADEKLPVGPVDETNERWAAMMVRDRKSVV